MPLVLDMQKISPAVWAQFQDTSGKILDEYSVKKWTFHEGISPESRREVWPFLLGYYPFLSTREEREAIDNEKRREYNRLLDIWQDGVMPDSLGEYIRVIGKDSLRTDRNHASFHGNSQEAMENIETLNRILTTYCVYNPELGYVQGMNEFLAPLFLVLGSEHQAFWCLTNILRRMTSVFSDLTLSQPLQTVGRLCYYADTQLHDHIRSIHGDDGWFFCYRGVLLNFKREFSMDDLYCLWEIIWCDHLTKHFQLFVAVAILVHYKQDILSCRTVEALMQFAMSLSCNAPLSPILTIARALAEQLKGEQYCPHELRYLVSDEGCAPPPLVGFVRARQKFSTLHSNKISMSSVWKLLFGDTSSPITSPFALSSTQATPTRPSALISPKATPTQHEPLDKDYVIINTPPVDTPARGGSRGFPLTTDTSSQSSTSSPLVPTTTSVSTSAHSVTGGTGGAGIGPPPREGFVPRNAFVKNSSITHHDTSSGCGYDREHSLLQSTSVVQSRDPAARSHDSLVQSQQFPAWSHDSRQTVTGGGSSQSSQVHSVTRYSHPTHTHPPPTQSPSHGTRPPPTLNSYDVTHTPTPSTPPHYTPTDHSRSQPSTTTTGPNRGYRSNSLIDASLRDHSAHAQNYPRKLTSSHSPSSTTRRRACSNIIGYEAYPAFPGYWSNTTCSYAENDWNESAKTLNQTLASPDAVHYDHRNGTLSGGVFGELEPVSTREVVGGNGTEFDHLRSEPSLLA